ncbi:MAG: hypothetical protein NZ748_06430, partial [Candidatus Marinimicrobia bacterium]|nr:hypothetical protein [Candidatus Neomarinimicrobiota bacterium]
MVRIPNKPSLTDQIWSILNHYWRQIAILLVVIAILSLFFPQGKALIYSYQLNDVAREEVVAPFNFPILKTAIELQSDLDEGIKSESFLFSRSQEVVDDQVVGVGEYFNLVKSIQNANKKLSDSQDSLYRNRFSDQYDAARIVFQSDSAALDILMARINGEFPFASDNEKWDNVFLSNPQDTARIDLEKLENDIIQISRNRWAEGIYDIGISEIVSHKVAVNIGNNEAPELTEPGTYNDLQNAWTKARVEVTNIFSDEGDVRRDLGYSLIIEFMKPNIIFDRETTERRQKARQDRVPRNKGIILKN